MVWNDIRQWVQEEDYYIRQKFDSLTLWTGDEGFGKSYTMIAKHKASDPNFNVDRIHMEEEPFMQDCVSLAPGSAVQLDEFKGHRRMAMHGHRLDFLTFLKERRSLRLRMGIGFPHVTQIDRDILNSRVRYLAHTPQRGLLQVYSRQSRTVVLPNGEIRVNVRWPHRGTFVIMEPKGALIDQYDVKKDAYTHRNPGLGETPPMRHFNPALAEDVLQEIKRSLRGSAVA